MFERFTPKFFKGNILSRDQYKPFPEITDREAWEGLPAAVKDKIMQYADGFKDYEIVPLTATLFMSYFREGVRTTYGSVLGQRRTALTWLTMAECLENKGRFMDKIIDIIWAICEESTWALPVHNYVFPHNLNVFVGCLPNPDKIIIDLIAADTGAIMSLAYYLLHDKLDEVSPLITRRMKKELKERIVDPYIEEDGYHWMGYEIHEDTIINNWTPWCTSNALMSVLLIEDDDKRREAAVVKAIHSMEVFVDTYNEEGNCNEGPGYWFHAAGCLFDVLYIIQSAGVGKIDFFEDNEKLRNMASYIAKVNIYGNHFVSFADCSETCGFIASKVYLFGKYTKNEEVADLAVREFKCGNMQYNLSGNLYAALMQTFYFEMLDAQEIKEPSENDVILRDLNIACFKEHDGFYLAMKGGNNDESAHNHNDVGNFLVYYKNKPIVVDMGVGEYTKNHWGPTRYQVFSQRSAYHNLPQINDAEEAPGENFKATDIVYTSDGNSSQVTTDIGGAYAPEAKVVSWERTYILHRGLGVDVSEKGILKEPAKLQFNFITPCEIKQTAEGILLDDVLLETKGLSYQLEIEKLELDGKLAKNWINGLHRVSILPKGENEKFEYTWSFRQAE